MEQCPICGKDADKENVHLIPWFLIKNCVTKGGSGVRDMELSFTIDPHRLTKIYAGRGILPETLEAFGDLHEAQKEKENPYSRDNLICTKCEEKLSRLEAIFASQFSERKLKASFQNPTITFNDNTILIDNKYNKGLYELLIQSIFYRCAIGNYNGFVLKGDVRTKIEENLRQAFSTENFKKIKPTDDVFLPYRFPLLTSAFYLEEGDDTTKNFVTVNRSRFPYFIMAGKWMFQLYEVEKQIKGSVEWLYGLRDKLNTRKVYDLINDTPHVVILGTDAGNKVYENLVYTFAKKKVIGIKRNIREFHQLLFKHKASEKIVEYIFQRYLVYFNKTQDEVDSMVSAFYDLRKLV